MKSVLFITSASSQRDSLSKTPSNTLDLQTDFSKLLGFSFSLCGLAPFFYFLQVTLLNLTFLAFQFTLNETELTQIAVYNNKMTSLLNRDVTITV